MAAITETLKENILEEFPLHEGDGSINRHIRSHFGYNYYGRDFGNSSETASITTELVSTKRYRRR